MKNILLGNTKIANNDKNVKGEFVSFNDDRFYKISNYNQMDDFFMTIVSVTDHWMFISSNGSLSAGRKNRDNALFPYYCVDKIHDYHNITGSKTLALIKKNEHFHLWEPFSKPLLGVYKIENNLYKNTTGNKIVFEEINHDLGVAFRYGWYFSEEYGFIKNSEFINLGSTPVEVEMLDGIQNILPHGFDYNFQLAFSNLLDAYKKNELVNQSQLAIFSLSSIPVDRAEPSEALKATTVWSKGLEQAKVLLSSNQLDNFRKGAPIHTENDKRATRGAYFLNSTLLLEANEQKDWYIVAEINQDSTQVENLRALLSDIAFTTEALIQSIEKDTLQLRRIVAEADGLQLSNEELTSVRHFSNTMYNIMRGGKFIDHYMVDKADFTDYGHKINNKLLAQNQEWFLALPEQTTAKELIGLAEKSDDFNLIRICYEYLPLTFSRRHGDPSRPWNQFSIVNETLNGKPKSDYQGNWRDIFQNWEALALSYPEFTEQMITKFVNASTADGYNPYRITRNGLDWEKPDPEDPWAYIGYWGDHQIIYLQKLLEVSHKYHPEVLNKLLSKPMFVYAHVPYKIKPYAEIVSNPQDTIVFDYELDNVLEKRFEETGADGKLLQNTSGEIYKVNFTEKILVSLLAKLSNFIPEAGIWLNTQRPEWNDANNALVGNGVSMVTLYYIRRFLKFWVNLFHHSNAGNIELSEEVFALLKNIETVFAQNKGLLQQAISNANRKTITDTLGQAGSTYREIIYNQSFSGKKHNITPAELEEFCALSLEWVDHSIKANKRKDGLYHAYNLVSFSENEIVINYLYEMLEGQVAVLTAGCLSAKESLQVLDALKSSSMFREDQYSYMLYPDRNLPLFIERNNIPASAIEQNTLLKKLIEQNDVSIVSKDTNGQYHFNGAFRNAEILNKALDALAITELKETVEKNRNQVLAVYESMFNHKAFTGRSGTFYGYEGLGSIYWHMVSKLLLATQEAFYTGIAENESEEILGRIKAHYYEIKAGIGLYKSPELYGAFPTDAYSHTPGHAGAQQPGMTGQVKEDFIARFGELGLMVENGTIAFNPKLMNANELLKKEQLFSYFDLNGSFKTLGLKKGEMAFTFCGVPVVLSLGDSEKITLTKNGDEQTIDALCIPNEMAQLIFNRTGTIQQVSIHFKLA